MKEKEREIEEQREEARKRRALHATIY